MARLNSWSPSWPRRLPPARAGQRLPAARPGGQPLALAGAQALWRTSESESHGNGRPAPGGRAVKVVSGSERRGLPSLPQARHLRLGLSNCQAL
eukprot:2019236-Rhodomonas_salina.1